MNRGKPMWGTRIASISMVTLAGAGWLWAVGPRPVVVVSTLTPETVPTWYILSAFPVLGMLVAEGFALAHRQRWAAALVLAAQIAVMVILSSGRLIILLPISGHVLLFAFFLTRRSRARRWTSNSDLIELATAASFGLATGFIKLVWWSDPITLILGLGTGVGLSLLGDRIAR
jgi:hypothetical protein